MVMKIEMTAVRAGAYPPKYMTAGAAGADLFACLDSPLEIDPGATCPVPTGIALAIPPGYGGFVFARSGLATRTGLAPANKVGVIDSDYRGEVIVYLHNHSNELRTVKPGERIAQMVFLSCPQAGFTLVDDLGDTERGDNGFGSTGQ